MWADCTAVLCRHPQYSLNALVIAMTMYTPRKSLYRICIQVMCTCITIEDLQTMAWFMISVHVEEL